MSTDNRTYRISYFLRPISGESSSDTLPKLV